MSQIMLARISPRRTLIGFHVSCQLLVLISRLELLPSYMHWLACLFLETCIEAMLVPLTFDASCGWISVNSWLDTQGVEVVCAHLL